MFQTTANTVNPQHPLIFRITEPAKITNLTAIATRVTDSPLILLGASIRSPAQSAALSQIPIRGADLFGDLDSRSVGDVRRVGDYPVGLIEFAEKFSPSLWMYGGALESHPRVVERLSKSHFLVGNPPDVLAQVRDFRQLQAWVQRCGLRTPATLSRQEFARQRPAGRWLAKPKKSAAGLGIYELDGNRGVPPRHIAQQRIDGQPGSCVFLSTQDPARCQILGTTEAIVVDTAPAMDHGAEVTPEFVYRGSIAAGIRDESLKSLLDLGDEVTRRAGIRGLWCVDFVQGDDCFVLEINPRWSASMELFERQQFVSLLPYHLRACENGLPGHARQQIDQWLARGLSPTAPAPSPVVWGKRIVYSPTTLLVDNALIETLKQCQTPGGGSAAAWPLLADIPSPGGRILRGHPLCTVFAAADDSESVALSLVDRTRQIERVLEADRTCN